MNNNVTNGLMKLVNSLLWAVLIKVVIQAGIEIWIFYQKTLPETINIEFYANLFTILVFFIALTTYKYNPPIIIKSPELNKEPVQESTEGLFKDYTPLPKDEEPDDKFAEINKLLD